LRNGPPSIADIIIHFADLNADENDYPDNAATADAGGGGKSGRSPATKKRVLSPSTAFGPVAAMRKRSQIAALTPELLDLESVAAGQHEQLLDDVASPAIPVTENDRIGNVLYGLQEMG
jgi:hypothetical protein